jgi:PRTRC genetic system ThiF family protein
MQLQLNTDLINAKPVILPPYEHCNFWIVGCGGTGSFLVQLVVRLASSLRASGKSSTLYLCDPDCIELHNLERQCFCAAELGLNKAKALAARYALAWNTLQFEAIDQLFDPKWIEHPRYYELTLLFGCVDQATGRRSLASAIDRHNCQTKEAARLWWLDCGNGERHGQVLVGSSCSPDVDSYYAEIGCLHLPAPYVQAPELLQDEPDTPALSCAEMAQHNRQSLTVNAEVASTAADLASDLLSGALNRFATYFDQRTGTKRSHYTSREAIERVLQSMQAMTSRQFE